MNLLAIDCSASLCAACVYDTATQTERGRYVLDLGKGHAEHLITVIGEALSNAGIAYPDLGAIGVSVGPGSFTGIRVAVSAARGFALALSIPAIGVSMLEALALETRHLLGATRVMAVSASGSENVHLAIYDAFGDEAYAPATMTFQEAGSLAMTTELALAGSAADRIAAECGQAFRIGPRAATADILSYARIAACRKAFGAKPSPLYLREPDARPQAGLRIERRSP